MPDQSSQAEIIKESSSEATLTTRFDFSLPPTLLAEHDHLGDGQKALTGPEASPSTTTTGQDEVAIVRQLHLARRSPSAIAPWGPHTVEESRLRVRTDLNPHLATGLLANEHVTIPGTSPRPPNAALSILTRTPSLRSTLSPSVTALDSTSPSSLSSPFLGAMAEITPLPSPLMMGDSPGPWHDESREPRTTISSGPSSDVVKQTPSDDPTWSPTPRSREKRKPYPVLIPAANEIGRAAVASDARNRSVSEYTAEVNRLPRPRIPTLSGPRPPPDELPTAETRLTREEYLAEGRGLAPPTAGLPSPPQSDRSKDESDRNGSAPQVDRPAPRHAWSTSPEWFAATSVGDNKRRRWRALRLLGQGTFSKVILAISDGVDGHHNPVNVEEPPSPVVDGTPLHDGDVNSRELVAVKVVQHGPAGGASEERVESSLKRELDIMRSIHHPSLVQLKAVDVEPSRALLVLRYCPGGDLFDLASQTRSPLSPSLIGRIFSELVTAVLYLHARYIVHRDIKLESMSLWPCSLTPGAIANHIHSTQMCCSIYRSSKCVKRSRTGSITPTRSSR